jgi:hypothetical protein
MFSKNRDPIRYLQIKDAEGELLSVLSFPMAKVSWAYSIERSYMPKPAKTTVFERLIAIVAR